MKIPIWILTISLLVACSPKIPTYSNQIVNFPETEDGTIYFQCNGTGSTKKAAYENAIYNAFSALLFQGIPSSVQTRPVIDPSNASNARVKVEDCLKNYLCYRNFIVQISTVDEYAAELKKGYSSSPKIKINLRALRTYLEQNSITPKAFTF